MSSPLESPSKLTLMKDKLKVNDGDDEYTRYSFHRCVIQAREEEVTPFAKKPASHVHQRTFHKSTPPSVFIEWREDSAKQMQDAFEADKINWKLFKFIKDPADLEASTQVLRDNFKYIREIFAMLSSKS